MCAGHRNRARQSESRIYLSKAFCFLEEFHVAYYHLVFGPDELLHPPKHSVGREKMAHEPRAEHVTLPGTMGSVRSSGPRGPNGLLPPFRGMLQPIRAWPLGQVRIL